MKPNTKRDTIYFLLCSDNKTFPNIFQKIIQIIILIILKIILNTSTNTESKFKYQNINFIH
jgi:hypothetical protein